MKIHIINNIVATFYKSRIISITYVLFFLSAIVYFRFCQLNSEGYPLPEWNFIAKENTHLHILFINLILLNFITDKVVKSLIWVDVIFCTEKIINQIIGLMYFGHIAPIWCNQRMNGYLMTFSIIILILAFYWKDFIRVLILIDSKFFHSVITDFFANVLYKTYYKIDNVKQNIKNKQSWQKIFGTL
jgi:hypothetical protein